MVPFFNLFKMSQEHPSYKDLEIVTNDYPNKDYSIKIQIPEFNCVCPRTGLPDFGEFCITYVPVDRCIELKSLKYYLMSFRNQGIYYENVTNQILDDLVSLCEPRHMTVIGDFSVRGGITTRVTTTHDKS